MSMKNTLFLSVFALFVISCGTISPQEDDDACIEVYDPVCGADGVTYSNTCFAVKAGIQEWTTGECAG